MSLPKSVQDARDYAITLAVLAGARFEYRFGRWLLYDRDGQWVCENLDQHRAAWFFLDLKGISFERD